MERGRVREEEETERNWRNGWLDYNRGIIPLKRYASSSLRIIANGVLLCRIGAADQSRG